MVNLFLAEYPAWVSALGRAIASHDAGQVKRAAHTLKGALSTLGARAAFDAALELEAMGRANDLSGVDDAFHALREALERLQPVLARCHPEPNS